MNAISASAVWTGEDGESYAWRVSRSDEFPESTFVVNDVPVAVGRRSSRLAGNLERGDVREAGEINVSEIIKEYRRGLHRNDLWLVI